jgi:hypothetical protein
LAELADAALAAIDGGVEPVEGLAIAALFYRMAAEREQPAAGVNHLAHAEMMLRRERLAREAQDDTRAVVAGAFALRALGRSADDGNEAAAARLSEVAGSLLPDAHTLAQGWSTGAGAEEHAAHDTALRLASEGDGDSLVRIIADAISAEQDGVIGALEALALCEQAGRFGHATGHGNIAVRLAGALLTRGYLEREAGRVELGRSKQVDGLLALTAATRVGVVDAGDALAHVVAITQTDAVEAAAMIDPTILAALPASGQA